MTRSFDGSRRAEATALPSWIKPQLTKLVDQPPEGPEGPEWLHEIKFDGYRIHARLDRGAVRLLTRTDLDWTHKYPAIAADDSPLEEAGFELPVPSIIMPAVRFGRGYRVRVPSPIFAARIRFGWVGPAAHRSPIRDASPCGSLVEEVQQGQPSRSISS